MTSEHVGFHFDVMCPWAYQSSVWIREVRRQTGLQIDWRFFSLEEINRTEGKKHPWERDWSYGWGMMRVAALLRRTSMDDCDRFYEAAGLRPDGATISGRIVKVNFNGHLVSSESRFLIRLNGSYES